jgi:tetratricopeptide (TPR) repeat protein
MAMKRWLVIGVIATAGALADDAAWRDAARLLVDDAHRQFVARGDRLGEAIALLNVQPKTSGNIERAAELLDRLRGADEIGIAATYYLARLEQIHRFRPNPQRALALYAELFRQHPHHPLAQSGVVKAALMRLYGGDADFAEIEASGRQLTIPEAVRDFHLALADAAGRLNLPAEKQLEHLLVVERVGVAKRKTAADLYVRIAELARESGRAELARQFYGKFLAEFPNDQRVRLVKERLAGTNP